MLTGHPTLSNPTTPIAGKNNFVRVLAGLPLHRYQILNWVFLQFVVKSFCSEQTSLNTNMFLEQWLEAKGDKVALTALHQGLQCEGH